VHRRLSAFCRLILFDRRGSGSSDAVSLQALPPLEARWAEVRAVMDAAGSERAVLLGRQDGGPPPPCWVPRLIPTEWPDSSSSTHLPVRSNPTTMRLG